jgi:hypothetical protein
MDYQKYLKYKNKYLRLKEIMQIGGAKFPINIEGIKVIVDRRRIAKVISVCENSQIELDGKTTYTVDYLDKIVKEREANVKEERLIKLPKSIMTDRYNILLPGERVVVLNRGMQRPATIIAIRDLDVETYSVKFDDEGHIIDNNVERSKISRRI